MRMWNVDPKLMCHRHLLGEHKELHMLAGSIRKGKSIAGYVSRGLVEPHKAQKRHDALVAEFRRRNWPSGREHNTPLSLSAAPEGHVSVRRSLRDLADRCPRCRERIRRYAGN